MKKIVVFAPHPDDETIGCGGTIIKKVKEGHQVHIVFLTDGRNSHLYELGIASDPTPDEVRKIRKEEAKRSSKILGVKEENLIFIDIEDGKTKVNRKYLQKKIKEILKEFQPDEVYFPDKEDLHSDHRTTNYLVKRSIKELSLHPSQYQYIIWPPNKKNFTSNKTHQVSVDISDVLAVKKVAINEYKSQTIFFSKKQKRPILESSFLDRFRKDVETFRYSK